MTDQTNEPTAITPVSMGSDVFNVRGDNDDFLLHTLRLAFAALNWHGVVGYELDETHGLILHKHNASTDAYHPFPTRLTADAVFPVIVSWLNSNPQHDMTLNEDDEFDEYAEDCELMWRVYLHQYNHLAIAPSWYGYGK